MNTPITFASVKVMRSFDYCHFEVSLSTSFEGISMPSEMITTAGITVAVVDDLRKEAARLADKAVAQYQKAKEVASRVESFKSKYEFASAIHTPEDQRTPEEKAVIKYQSDVAFASKFDYDYEDDYEEPSLDE